MAILGSNTDGGSNAGTGVGRMVATQYTLAEDGTLTALNGWFAFGTGADSVRVVIYKHVSGSDPTNATLVAYTNPLSGFTGSPVQLGQTGFSVALTAGDYWIGYRSATADNFTGRGGSGFYRGIVSGVADPPPGVFGAPNFSASLNLSCWAVYTPGAAAPAFVPQIVIT